jgi:hypothetical protein
VNSGAHCAEARDLFPELAMDVAAGDERARALRHLGGCPECRRELAATADAVDEMLLLAPEVEPPAGFERSVLARLTPATGPQPTAAPAVGPAAQPAAQPAAEPAGGPAAEPAAEPAKARFRRLAVPLLWAASIVAVAVLAGSAVWSRTADDRNLASDYRHTLDVAHGRGLSAAPLLAASGTETGTVFAYEGHEGSPSWVYVTFRTPPQPGQYDVHLVTKDGRRLPLRPFTARPGGIAWGSIIPVSTKEIATIEFSRSDGTPMTARF